MIKNSTTNIDIRFALLASLALLGASSVLSSVSPARAATISGRVLGARAPIVGSTVTLLAATSGNAQQVAQTQTGADGRFSFGATPAASQESTLYLVAGGGHPTASQSSGDNPAIVLITALGASPPATVTINEMTTVATVWTHNQFIAGRSIGGNALGLRIAAGNVPSFVELQTGGWGATIQDPLNSSQTPTMANFATLADVLAGCVIRVTADACSKLFAAATPPGGSAPNDTLAAAHAIAGYSWYQPQRVFALLDAFYPVPRGKNLRPVPFMPYLNTVPSAWVLPLKFDGGGYRAGGGAMFDSEGNLWTGDNFTVGWQGRDALWQGSATKFNPNGKPLSPITTGFTGGGMEGGSFGAAVDAKDNAWISTYGSQAIAVFDKNGKPVSPPEGITLGGKLGKMQGIIVAPSSGDVWALGVAKDQLVYFPGGDWTKGRLVCEGKSAEPCKSFTAPFHLAIDRQNRIWVSNTSFNVTRFPVSDPSKAENFRTGGVVNSGMNIDSQGNVWVTNRFGHGLLGMSHMIDMAAHLKAEGMESATDYLVRTMSEQKGRDGSVTLLRPDGTHYPGSPFTGDGLPGPWAVVVDGNDNVWISNFALPNSPITQLCGVRTENCPPGFKTGDQISPPGGYVGGGLQMQTDLAISPSGDVWVMNNWQDIDSCYKNASEALSTRCGGQGVTVFFGMAKPVRAPQIGPARGYE